MRHKFLICNGSDTLLMFFAGWGMDGTPFAEVKPSCDLMICYDYRSMEFDADLISSYKRIYVVGWSFGVYAATCVMRDNPSLPICRKIAINGTMSPINDGAGISVAVFDATLNSLDEQSLIKFNRRMCGGKEAFDRFMMHHPDRRVEDLRDELIAFRQAYEAYGDIEIMWDLAIIGKLDRIFPCVNQENAWKHHAWHINIIDEPHLPLSLNNIIETVVIDKNLLKKRFTRQYGSYDDNAVAQHAIAERLLELWQDAGLFPGRDVLEIGCGTGWFTRLYSKVARPRRLVLNDMCDIRPADVKCEFVCADAETLDFDAEFDYVVSTSAIQWLDSPINFLRKAIKWLKNDGVMAVSVFGSENMRQLNGIISNALLYPTENQLTNLLSDVADIVTIKSEIVNLSFKTPIEVLKHIKNTGVNALRQDRIWTKSDIARFEQKYPIDENGLCELTYNPIYIILKKKQSAN